MKHIALSLLVVFMASPSFAYKQPSEKFKKNYKRYKAISPEKKSNMRNKWKAFKKQHNWDNLSPEQRRKLKRKVLSK